MDRTGCDKETASAALRSLGGDIDAATQAVLAEREHEASAKRPRTENAAAAPSVETLATGLVIKLGVGLFPPQFMHVESRPDGISSDGISSGKNGFKAFPEDDDEVDDLLRDWVPDFSAALDVFIAPDEGAFDDGYARGLCTTVVVDGKHQPHAFFSAEGEKLVLAGTTRDGATGKKVLTVESHKFKNGHPTLQAEDGAPVGPVAFLSGGGMVYAVEDDGTPAGFTYYDPCEVQRHFLTHHWTSNREPPRPVGVGPATVEC